MTKFIVIDNSIENTAGHHYQYAAHCLQSANDLGLIPIMATNKAYSPQADSKWAAYPVYSFGFWRSYGKGKKLLINLDRKISIKINQIKYKAIFSKLGISLENRDLLFNQIDIPGEESIKHPLAWVLLSSIAVPLFMISSRTRRSLNNLKRRISYLPATKKKIDPINGIFVDDRSSQTFGNDTQRLFKKVKLEEGDIVFIPTVGITELLGLLRFFGERTESKRASWHLLFRRNIYSGRESEYWKQDESLRFLRHVLISFVQNLSGQKVFFYTDSEELTTQYNRLSVARFHTLPLPHTVSPASKEITEKYPLSVAYIGDARTEKGYQYLPNVVEDLWSDYVENGKVRFVLQSNFNTPKGEPKVVVARSQLETYPKDKVRLIYNSLSFDEYITLLLSSDIVLLPYEYENYYARSSGILVECLAAGIPVITPSATWLSRQFINEIYKYHEYLRESLENDESYTGEELSWRRHETDLEPFVNGDLIFGGESTKAYCSVNCPTSSNYMYIGFTMKTPWLSCVRIDVAQLRIDSSQTKFSSSLIEKVTDGIMSMVIPLEKDCRRIWLGFKNAFDNSAMNISRLNISFLSKGAADQTYPRGAVGLAYDNPNEISDLLSEIIDNYSHYRKTALEFSEEYMKIHNASGLLQEINNNNDNKNKNVEQQKTEKNVVTLTE